MIYNKKLLQKRFSRKLWFLLLLVPPIFLGTFRYNVGTDYNSYIRLYHILSGYSFSQYISTITTNVLYQEPLWFLLNKISFIFFSDETAIFFLSSLITMLFVILGIRNFAKDVPIGYALFIFFMVQYNMSFNAIRTLIAASIIFFALKYIYQKKIWKYLFAIILAAGFHKTAFIAILFYLVVPIGNKDLNRVKKFLYYLLILLTPIVLLVGLEIAKFIPIFDKYFYKYDIQSLNFGIGFLLYVLPFLVPILIQRTKIIRLDKNYSSLVDIALFHIPLRYMGYFTEYGHRLEVYISIVYIILIPLTIKSASKNISKILLFSYYSLVLLGYYIFIYIYTLGHGTYPYFFNIG